MSRFFVFLGILTFGDQVFFIRRYSIKVPTTEPPSGDGSGSLGPQRRSALLPCQALKSTDCLRSLPGGNRFEICPLSRKGRRRSRAGPIVRRGRHSTIFNLCCVGKPTWSFIKKNTATAAFFQALLWVNPVEIQGLPVAVYMDISGRWLVCVIGP